MVFPAWTAAMTTELAVGGPVHYLPFWQEEVTVTALPDCAWERLRRITTPQDPHLYVPAFSLRRPVVQLLGVRLTETQPFLDLGQGLRPRAAGGQLEVVRPVGPHMPVVIGRADARTLCHFVYLAFEAHESRELRSVDYDLTPKGEELVFIPAVWDPRQIREANWRVLLREFDDLVA